MSVLYNHSLHFLRGQYEGNPEKQAEIEHTGGLHGIRILPHTTPEDALQLDPRLRENYAFMQDYFRGIGLAVASEVIWDTAVDVGRDYPGRELSVYAYADAVHAVRPDAKRLEAVTMADNKNSFITYCVENGYPVPRTLAVDDTNAAVPDFTKLALPLYVKAARSSSGSSIFKCKSYDEVATNIKRIGSSYQIQEEVPNVQAFLNVQYQSTGEDATHLATTEQILNGFSHAGNRYPAVFNPRDITDPLANELVKRGLRDIFAFDVAVTPHGMLLIECNARWNGSSYPTMAAKRLDIPEWMAVNMGTSLSRPEDIKLGDFTYDQASRFGIVILNSSLMSARRKVSLLLAGNQDEQQALRATLPKILR